MFIFFMDGNKDLQRYNKREAIFLSVKSYEIHKSIKLILIYNQVELVYLRGKMLPI